VIDSDGYPEPEVLMDIMEWTARAGHHELMQEIVPLFEQYGRCEYRDIDGVWEVVTGGWSGCEQVIQCLQENTMFWVMCWRLSKRGGYYEFKTTPKGATDNEMD